MNRCILRRSQDVVVLDRFMAERVRRKLDVTRKLSIIPPWPHEEHLEPVPAAENPFRDEHDVFSNRKRWIDFWLEDAAVGYHLRGEIVKMPSGFATSQSSFRRQERAMGAWYTER